MLSQIANSLAIYILERPFRIPKHVQLCYETMSLTIQAIPKDFPYLFLNVFFWRKNNICYRQRKYKKEIGHNTLINEFYMDSSKNITMFY